MENNPSQQQPEGEKWPRVNTSTSESMMKCQMGKSKEFMEILKKHESSTPAPLTDEDLENWINDFVDSDEFEPESALMDDYVYTTKEVIQILRKYRPEQGGVSVDNLKEQLNDAALERAMLLERIKELEKREIKSANKSNTSECAPPSPSSIHDNYHDYHEPD